MGNVGQLNPEPEVLQRYSPRAGKGMGPVERGRADRRALLAATMVFLALDRWIARGWERVAGASA